MVNKLSDIMKKKSLEESINSYGDCKELLRACIKQENDEVYIDWGKIKEEHDKYSNKNNIRDYVTYVLQDIGLLSAESNGNYLVQGEGIALSPPMFYFTREKDAADYKKTFFNNVQYTVKIFKGIN